MDASDAIHDIHGLMALDTRVSGHCAINLDEILLQSLHNDSANKKNKTSNNKK